MNFHKFCASNMSIPEVLENYWIWPRFRLSRGPCFSVGCTPLVRNGVHRQYIIDFKKWFAILLYKQELQ